MDLVKQNLLSSVIWYEMVSFAANDRVLLLASKAVTSGSGDGGSNSGTNSATSRKTRGKLVCECGTAYELTVPRRVLGSSYFFCSDCRKQFWNNERFYYCPNSSANRHPYTSLCASCGDKRREKISKDVTTTTTAETVAIETDMKNKNETSKKILSCMLNYLVCFCLSLHKRFFFCSFFFLFFCF